MVSLKIKQLPTAVRSTSSKRKLLGPSWEEEAETEGDSFPEAPAVSLLSSSSCAPLWYSEPVCATV